MTQDITAIDFFCGAGGSSTGLVNAGLRVTGAANHWKLAIDTHNTNHPSTEHFQDDLQQAHASWYPYADIAWFSPECKNHSLAKGKKRKGINQLDLWGEHHIDPAEEKSRATMREVVEFSEYHRYKIVIVENVVDVRNWQHYETWLDAMTKLGYDHKILYLNAQFFGVPQSRDRFYAVFWRRGNKAPNLDFRPAAQCPKHGAIHAVQTFKKPDFPWGRWGARRQYTYRCPQCGAEVIPYYQPAANVIDWSLPSQKIGDRKKPLEPKTIQRIVAGLKKFGHWPHIANTSYTHAGHDGKVKGVDEPLATQTTQQSFALVQPFITSYYSRESAKGWPVSSLDESLPVIPTEPRHALVTPPFMIVLKNSHSKDGKYTLPPRALDEALTTIVASGSQHALITPFIASQHLGRDAVRRVDRELPCITTMNNEHALVTPPFIMAYYTNPVFAEVDKPLPTIPTIEKHALVTPEAMLPECGFRMLEPHELKLGMSFPDEYIILGNKRDQVKQIGHAVACNVAQWIAERCVESLA